MIIHSCDYMKIIAVEARLLWHVTTLHGISDTFPCCSVP